MDGDKITLADMQDRVRERADAYLTLYSETESPDAIAANVGLTPDAAWHKGEPRGTLRKPAPMNAVTYESGLPEDRAPSDHVSALAQRLRPFTEQIRAVTAADGNSGCVRVVEHAGFSLAEYGIGNAEAWVGPADLETFGAMGVSLGFDVYLSANDD